MGSGKPVRIRLSTVNARLDIRSDFAAAPPLKVDCKKKFLRSDGITAH
jgi:hypothetical protein